MTPHDFERRKAVRFGELVPVQMTVFACDGRCFPLDGRLMNMSPHGFALEIPTALSVEDVVVFEAVTADGIGQRGAYRIAHCRATPDDRFVLGVELLKLDPSVRDVRHLVDIAKIRKNMFD